MPNEDVGEASFSIEDNEDSRMRIIPENPCDLLGHARNRNRFFNALKEFIRLVHSLIERELLNENTYRHINVSLIIIVDESNSSPFEVSENIFDPYRMSILNHGTPVF